jgi:hypothetical protein
VAAADPGTPAREAGSGIRASRRSMKNTITARTRYTADSAPYPTGTLLAPVTAADTRMTW